MVSSCCLPLDTCLLRFFRRTPTSVPMITGGLLENRMRFLMRTIQTVRDGIGRDRINGRPTSGR